MTQMEMSWQGCNAEEEVEQESLGEACYLMKRPFDPTQINIDTKTPSLDTLIKRIAGGTIAMNTEEYFQRQDDLWDPAKQSRLIESILIRFPLPAFFFDATNDNYWLIVDGLQRLSSIRNFCVKKSLKLTNLEFLTQFEGKSWNDLSVDLQRTIEETQVVIYKIMPGTPNDVKFNIFKRINTGGLSLESQEIRHALFQGVPARFVARLADSQEFKVGTSHRISPRRMLDREFVTRFLAFYLLGTQDYQADLESYMNRVMAYIAHLPQSELDAIEIAFKRGMCLANDIFGHQAFRKVTGKNHQLPPVNKALFDALATRFAKLNNEQALMLIKNKSIFVELFQTELSLLGDFFASVSSSTGDKKWVAYRHAKVQELIDQTINEVKS